MLYETNIFLRLALQGLFCTFEKVYGINVICGIKYVINTKFSFGQRVSQNILQFVKMSILATVMANVGINPGRYSV